MHRHKTKRRYLVKCQRCLGIEEATYRVYSDAINLKVCAGCAEEAQKIGIPVEPLEATSHQAFGLPNGDTGTI
jgi:hypothetical protein